MDQFVAPFGQEIELREIIHDTGVPLMRIVLRDGGKYQTLDLDPATAFRWGTAMSEWAQAMQEKYAGEEDS